MAISAGQHQFPLRIPNGMRDRIRANAEANRRSMNAEIIHYLDRALAAEEKSPASVGALPGQGHQPTLEKADERRNQ